jgi:CRP-like cAMP-binding protein
MNATNSVDIASLQDFIPLNALTRNHLKALLRDKVVDVICAGTTLFSSDEQVNVHIFLLSGELQLLSADGDDHALVAGSESALHPVTHHWSAPVSATAISDCQILRLDNEQLDKMLCWDQAADYLMSDLLSKPELDEDIDWIFTLLKSNLFYEVPPMNIEQVIDCFEPCVVESGEVILRQGELGDYCYVIKEGQAEVLVAENASAKVEQVAILESGRAFGEEALLRDTCRNATVRMQTHGVLMRLHKQDFQKLLAAPSIEEISLPDARNKIEQGSIWLDVRSQQEYEHGHCAGAPNFPLNLLKMKSRLLDNSTTYITYCNTGRRSMAAACLLQGNGYKVIMLEKGLDKLPDDVRAGLLKAGDDTCVQRLMATGGA